MLKIKPGIVLWKHQKKAVDWLVKIRHGLLAADMGTGKTLIALTACSDLRLERVLVVTTKKGVRVWVGEIEKFADASYLALDGNESVANKAKMLLNIFTDITIINYDILWRPEIIDALTKYRRFDAIILDESHRIKAPNSKVSKAAYKLAQQIYVRFALSGTPLPNGPMDIFGQARFIDDNSFYSTVENRSWLRSFNHFRSRYCELAPVGPIGIYKIIGYRNMDEFNANMNKFTLKITDDVLDLPESIHIQIPIELPRNVRKIYNELNKEFLVELENKTVVADNILVKTLRLAQITGGFLSGEFLHSEKVDAVVEIIESMPNEPIVIFCRFTDEISLLYDTLHIKYGYNVARLTGSLNTLADFQQLRSNIILVQIDAGAEAISLVMAKYVIFYSIGYSLGTYEQALARVRRPGQTSNRVFYYHLVARNTVDNAIALAIQNKSNIRDEIFKQIKDVL